MNKEFEKKKVVILIVVGTVIFFLVWLMIYVPKSRNLRELQKEVAEVNSYIKRIESVFEGSMTTADRIKTLEEKYARLENQFPAKEERALQMISDFARGLNVQVDSIKAQEKTDIVDSNNQKVEVDGKFCQCVTVSMELRTSYQGLISYMEKVKTDLPAYVTFEKIEVQKGSAVDRLLNISLNLRLYLLN